MDNLSEMLWSCQNYLEIDGALVGPKPIFCSWEWVQVFFVVSSSSTSFAFIAIALENTALTQVTHSILGKDSETVTAINLIFKPTICTNDGKATSTKWNAFSILVLPWLDEDASCCFSTSCLKHLDWFWLSTAVIKDSASSTSCSLSF